MSDAAHAGGVEGALLRLGVSACLLGEMVRWNGGHKRDRYLTDVLGPNVDWSPICPEVEIGLGVPRPTVRLVGTTEDTRLVEPESGEDLTQKMKDWADGWLGALAPIDGFILKRGSPSCGPDRVRRYETDIPVADSSGIFAAALAVARPHIALIDDGRLRDPDLREDFFDHAMWHRRWRALGGATKSTLMDFHRDNKLTYMAHHPDAPSRLGRIATEEGDADAYAALAADIMATPTTRGRQANVMQHILGYVSDHLGSDDRAELVDLIDAYRQGLMPPVAPLTLLRHHVRREPVPEWLTQQTYLEPLPREWVVRNRG